MSSEAAVSLSTTAVSSTLGDDKELLLAQRIAVDVKNRWGKGERPDVAAVLAEHSELKRFKSIALDLAYTEYQLRLKEGESLEPDEFASRFPSLHKSLCLLIEVQRLLHQDPRLRDIQEDLFWPDPGEHFLGFSLIAELGRGTFGRVFLASEPALGDRLVALKVAPQGGEEAEMLGKLRHPNVMPVYSVQEDRASGLTAVCMPYLGRATFRDVLDSAFAVSGPPVSSQVVLDTIQTCGDIPLPADRPPLERILRRGSYVDVVLHFAVQLADALAYTHSRGICHRDLKPSNVLVSFDGRPLLLDFNLSSDAELNVQRIGGTLPYMAPEQLQLLLSDHPDRQSRPPDPRSDLFSLGVILYELLCGSFPFGAIPWDGRIDEISQHLLQQQKKGPRPLREKNDRVDKRVERLIQQCLAFDPEDRPETAGALSAALRRQVTPLRRGKRWARNHRGLVSLCLTSLAAIVLAVGAFFALRDPYSVRQFHQGQEFVQQAQYERAVECFDQSIRSDPKYYDAIFARGRAYEKLGDFRQAVLDFGRVRRDRPTAEACACEGFCLTKLRFHQQAIQPYEAALSLGLGSAAILNNIGFSHLQMNRPDSAEEYFKKSLALDKRLEAAHLNLLAAVLMREAKRRPLPASVLVYCEKALEVCSPSSDLFFSTGGIYALAARDNPAFKRQAIACLEKAVAHGYSPKSFQSVSTFTALRDDEEFKELLRAVPGPKASSRIARVIHPLD